MCDSFKIIILTLSMLVVACGTVPVPKASSRQVQNRSIEQPPATSSSASNSVNSRLQASQSKYNPSSSSTRTTDNKKSSVATTVPISKPYPTSDSSGLTAKEYVQNALGFLQNGQEGRAINEISRALALEPKNKVAQKLQTQILTDADEYFSGWRFIKRKLKRGESLSTLARKYLGDSSKFYILAKYNRIDNPNKIKIGQMLNIPIKTPKASISKSEKKAAKREPTAAEIKYTLAQKLYSTGKYQETIDILEPQVRRSKKAVKSRDLLVLAYTKYATVLEKKANLLEAQTVLEKALIMQPKNNKLKIQLKKIKNTHEANRLYQVGVNLLQENDQDRAYAAFHKVLKLKPKHVLARKQIVGLKSDVIDGFHKKAMQSYKRQLLDEAIEIWDKLLDIDPEHELAKLYRARAINLKKRLKNL